MTPAQYRAIRAAIDMGLMANGQVHGIIARHSREDLRENAEYGLAKLMAGSQALDELRDEVEEDK